MTEPRSPGVEPAPRVRVIVVSSAGEDGPWVSDALAESRTRTFDVETRSLADLEDAPVEPDAADVMVLRVSDADADPVGVVRRIVQAHERLPVVAIGDQADEAFAFAALDAGAVGCLARADVAPLLLATTLATAVQRHRTGVYPRRAQERALHLTTHDPVTKLGNRALFMDRVAQAIALARRTL